MGAQILITSPYPEFTLLVTKICEELGVEAQVQEEVLDNAVRSVTKAIAENPDIEVIISRAGTAQAIKEAVDIPVLIVEGTDFDILQALREAQSVSNRIGFLMFRYYQIDYDFKNIEEILGIEVKQYFYTNRRELHRQVENAYNDGIEVIVGGGEYGVKLAQAYGMKGGLIRSSRRAVVQAIQRAVEILRVIKREREYEEQLKTIINFSYDGIIALDKSGNVTFFNPIAEKIFNIETSKVQGKNFRELEKLTGVEGIFDSHTPLIGHLRQIGKSRLVINRVPIKLDNENLGTVFTFQDVTKIQRLEQQIRKELYRKGLVAKFSAKDIVAESKVMQEVLQMAEKFGRTDSTILLTGESGTGKELMAQSIHRYSERKNGPFVAVNCAALPEHLLESELFGYEEGAFTGAKKGGKPGLFELAHGGTIFLDEIGSVSGTLQAHLLRVLQEKEVRRIGGDSIIPVDARVIAATNVDLMELVHSGAFRIDLYYRLNVLNLRLPPLRERKQDIPSLVMHFLNKFNKKLGKEVTQIPAALWQWLIHYEWPGNIRELENIVQRCVILAEGSVLEEKYIEKIIENSITPLGKIPNPKEVSFSVSPKSLADMEIEIVKKMESVTKGNKTELARMLGISRTTLWKKLKNIEKKD